MTVAASASTFNRAAKMPWLDMGDAVLRLPVRVICDLLADEGQFARDLRRSSPDDGLA